MLRKSLIIMVVFLVPLALWAQSGDELLRSADDIFDIDQLYQKSTLTVTRNGRTQPVQTMESYYQEVSGESRSLAVFLAPARVKGTAYLTLDNDLWVRFGSTGRIRKLSSSAKKNSAAGSDFTYIDMGEGNDGYSAKYMAESGGTETIDGMTCRRLVLTPRPGAEDVYEKIVAFIHQDSLRYISLELWEDGAHIKTMDFEDYRTIDGLDYPYIIRMTSRTRDSETVIETEILELNSARVQTNMFSQSYLRNIR